MELIESLKPIFDFLIKYYLFHTILSIVFSLIIARIYYYFFLKKNIETLETEHENEILKKQTDFEKEKNELKENYSNEIKTLKEKISKKDERIHKLELENIELRTKSYTNTQIYEQMVQHSRRGK
ncbi:hypothetical protein [Fusobacterium sp.]|jgi:hypothetical protein|uniref:Uncharacterized protein n=1 Tax=Fusobacterium nucleatum TaxID=851 RepID=A0A323TZX4_FUSNU|nr:MULTISPECIES: hypothetical protein [Fusobacterium]PZA05469.1 hypothetical protein DNF10_01090 [Fusobacterium nucleatum]QJX50285.1 hypothetical protein HOO60_05165 [Fusobacterium nucleatum]HCE33448.1 hypothetical protein [Fusobacterium sp.]